MKLRGLLAGLALITLANAALLAGVAWNRRGEPDATVTLTERELKIPWTVFNDEEDTGLELQLEWNARWAASFEPLDEIPLATLRELGFRPEPGRTEPPRAAWVVLEMDGEAWRRWVAEERRGVEEKKLEEPESDCPPGAGLEQMLVNRSRLMVVDAGKDREALRRRHPDRSHYLVVPGSVEAREVEPGVFKGVVDLRVDSIHVPLRLRPVLDEIVTAGRLRQETSNSAEPGPPRFRATVAFGRRGEPWLVDVEKLPAPATPLAGFVSGCSG